MQGTEDEASSFGSPAAQLPPPWKMMLLSDGSVTRHLQLLTGQTGAVVRPPPPPPGGCAGHKGQGRNRAPVPMVAGEQRVVSGLVLCTGMSCC